MEPSLFIELVEARFSKLVLALVETINGEPGQPKPYYFQRFLTRKFSLTGKWEALSVSGSRVMADIVAMDSSIPLKKRGAISSAKGEIPKLAMELALNESDLVDLQMMASSSLTPEGEIIERLFADTATAVLGQYERLEHMFLEGLSLGYVVVSKDNNVGTEIRLDYNYLPEQSFTTALPWSDPDSTPIQDMANMQVKAKLAGSPIRRMLMKQSSLDDVLKNDEAKALYAENIGAFAGVPFPPTFVQLNVALKSKYGFEIEVIDRVSRYQIDGVDYDVEPWVDGQVVGINNDRLGSLVWSMLAEMNSPVAGVTYQRADQFILASKYRIIRPSLAEITSSQSRATPVIADVKQIFHLDTTTTSVT